jgi:TM2 domain-containing membrane protein YozV
VVAALLSALACPGVGQLYKGHRLRGILLVIASVLIVTVVVAKVWMTMFELTMSMPPDELLGGLLGTTHRIMEAEGAFLGPAMCVFLAVWGYGIIDALAADPD